MKSWQRHFILGIIAGIVTRIIMQVIFNSAPGYDWDLNLVIVILMILSYGVGTAILGEILMVFDRDKK